MPHFRIHMINSDFESSEYSDYPSLDAALKAGLTGASRVAMEAIADGHESSAVEVRIEQDERVVSRRVLTFSVSDLLTAD